MKNLYQPHVFLKTDTIEPKSKKRYLFREDYNLKALPEKETTIQPKGYRHQAAKELLQYSDLADKMDKENYFKKIQKYYDEGLQAKDPLPDFGNYSGFAGLDKIYTALYSKRNRPFPGLIGAPKQHDIEGQKAQIQAFWEKREKQQKMAGQYAQRPYRFVHYPWPAYIGSFLPNKNDGVTYKSTVSYDEIVRHFRKGNQEAKGMATQKLKGIIPKAGLKARNFVDKYFKLRPKP